MSVEIYTDGACSGNPGVGGWGSIIIISKKEPVYLNGGEDFTTNNQMELTATIKSLQYFELPETIKIFTDSKYVMNGIKLWINNWKKNGWKTASKKPVKNKNLWEDLDNQILKHTIEWEWVKGHSGNKYNEIADTLARKYIENKQ
jgi:ribonuclease HI